MSKTFDHTFNGKKHPVPYRDNQKSKVYAGERAAFGRDFWALHEGGDFQAACDFANKVLRSKTWLRIRKQHGMLRRDGKCWVQETGEFRISDGRGTRIARGGGRHLNLPRWARTKSVILHKIAHCLAGASTGHNWPFCRAFIDLVRVFISKEAGERLDREFKKAGARTWPKRQLSPEALKKMRAQGHELAKLAAKRREETE